MPHEFESYRLEIDKLLDSLVTNLYEVDGTLADAVRYILCAPGKRVRPIFCLLSARSIANDHRSAMLPAAAVEMVHAYSLTHDDLPPMDDDPMRRGQAAAHIKFGEATALLAGDALLTDAFCLLATSPAKLAPEVSADQCRRMVGMLGHAAGGSGMVKGQILDLAAGKNREPGRLESLNEIHLLKTGRLLGAACGLGAIAAGADDSTVEKFRQFGEMIGLAFQIIDDSLDDTVAIGKTPGKDRASGKLSYLSFMDRAACRQKAEEYTHAAWICFSGLDTHFGELKSYTARILDRNV